MTHSQTSVVDPAATSGCSQGDAFAILSTCHEHIGQRLVVLEQVGRELLDAVELSDHHLARLGEVLAFLDTAIPIHSADEEQSLFPRLRGHPPFTGTGGTPMDCMEAEHVAHGELLARLKAAIVKRRPAAVGRYALDMVAEYRGHIEKEELILYPMARQVLHDPVVVQEMTAEMRARRKQLGLSDC